MLIDSIVMVQLAKEVRHSFPMTASFLYDPKTVAWIKNVVHTGIEGGYQVLL